MLLRATRLSAHGSDASVPALHLLDRDRGGVAPERWHLSHEPTASSLEEALSVGTLRAVLQNADLELKDVVLGHLDDIYERFVINTNRMTA